MGLKITEYELGLNSDCKTKKTKVGSTKKHFQPCKLNRSI